MSNRIHENNLDTQIAEFGADTIHRLPHTPEYIKALTQQGPSTYIDNARVEMKAIIIDDIILPIVISNPKHGNADVCSPYSHYVQYTLEELIKRNKKMPEWLFKTIVGSFGSVLKICKIDRVVYINNWLFATNPHQPLTSQQIYRITAYLQERYPGHAIVHRSVNPYLHKCYYDALQENGYTMVKSRTVYLLDPSGDEFLKRDNARRDIYLLQTTPYTVVSPQELSNSEIRRLAQLYRSLYLDKHSYLNPQLNSSFFSLTFRNNTLTYKVFKTDGRIDAFTSYYIRDGVLTGAFIGYDRSLPQKVGLYRMAVAILISEAKSKGLLLNLSAGCGAFKAMRGAFPVVEYDAVHDRHLPHRRCFAWRLVRMEGGLWSLGF